MNESRIRLLTQQKSSVFSQDYSGQSINPFYGNSSKSRNFSTTSLKPKDQSYSELFGNHSYLAPKRNYKGIAKEQLLTPRVGKQMSIKMANNAVLPKPFETKLEVLQISGLKPYDNEASLKKIANKHHIEVDTEFDNVKGICTGKGKISIRSFPNEKNKEQLVLKLKNQGYIVNDGKINNNKKNCADYFANSNMILRCGGGTDRVNISKENFEKLNTPRYMKSTTSFANKLGLLTL